MKTRQLTLSALLATALFAGCTATPPATPSAAAPAPAVLSANAKSVPGDAAIPIAELMPLVVRHEVDLKLTPEQIKAVTAYRETNMPKRIAMQKQVLGLRSQLRAAVLDGQPIAERERLMQQVANIELEHMRARDRCAVFMRETLDNGQYTQVTRLYLDGLR